MSPPLLLHQVFPGSLGSLISIMTVLSDYLFTFIIFLSHRFLVVTLFGLDYILLLLDIKIKSSVVFYNAASQHSSPPLL